MDTILWLLVGEQRIFQARGVAVDLLFAAADGRYRIARIFRAHAPNEAPPAALAAPGVRVREGEFLLEIDGQDLTASEDLHRLLVGKAGRPVELRIGPHPS